MERSKSVVVINKKKEPIVVPPVQVLPPTTTHEENVVTSGQRRINLIWEITQALIALSITGSIIYNASNKINSDVLTNAFFLIVSMYFVRTNHNLIGGTGQKSKTQTR